MTKKRWLLAGIIGVLGIAQSLDSGVHHSSSLVMALVVLAVALPVVNLLFDSEQPLWGALASVVLLTVARIVSPIPLPGLHISLVFLGGFPLFYYGIFQQHSSNGTPGTT